MVEVSITSIGLILCIFGLSLIIFLLWPRESRQTTVPGPDKPESTQTFLAKLRQHGFSTFLQGLHAQYGGMTAFYFGHRLIFSIQDEETIEKTKTQPIPVPQHYRNFKCDEKSMGRQRFRQVRKWFEGGGQAFIEEAISSSCFELNAIWQKSDTISKAAQHVAALSMQIAGKSFCGISDHQQLTELRKHADKVIDQMNQTVLSEDQTAYEAAYAEYESALNGMGCVMEKCLRSSVPSASGDYLLSGYVTLNAAISALFNAHAKNPSQIALSELIASSPILQFTCSIQDAGLSIQIGSHNIPNDAIILTDFSRSSTNMDCWSQYPLGMFSICSNDPKLWGNDILFVYSMLTRDLALSVPKDQSVQFEGDFLKIPSNFTLVQ